MITDTHKESAGFTLVEMLVAMVIGSMLITAVFRIWRANQSETIRIGDKSDFRDRATLATTALNRAVTMAGFGMTKMNVIKKGAGTNSDTLTVYSNPQERRTTLRDTAREGSNQILAFTDSGFVVGGLLGITDSLKQEYAQISGIQGDTANGFRITLVGRLTNTYKPGVPDIYPVEKERFYIEDSSHTLLRMAGDRPIALAKGIYEFRVDLKDGAGNPTNISKNMRVVSFQFMGTFKAPQGTPNQMRFSSTVIPRNIL
jgi:prepilin-type N-terminal cleavage/methylation domain-containing protein